MSFGYRNNIEYTDLPVRKIAMDEIESMCGFFPSFLHSSEGLLLAALYIIYMYLYNT